MTDAAGLGVGAALLVGLVCALVWGQYRYEAGRTAYDNLCDCDECDDLTREAR